MRYDVVAGWSSLVARWAHNPKVGGSNPPPATKKSRYIYFRGALRQQRGPFRGSIAPDAMLDHCAAYDLASVWSDKRR